MPLDNPYEESGLQGLHWAYRIMTIMHTSAGLVLLLAIKEFDVASFRLPFSHSILRLGYHISVR